VAVTDQARVKSVHAGRGDLHGEVRGCVGRSSRRSSPPSRRRWSRTGNPTPTPPSVYRLRSVAPMRNLPACADDARVPAGPPRARAGVPSFRFTALPPSNRSAAHARRNRRPGCLMMQEQRSVAAETPSSAAISSPTLPTASGTLPRWAASARLAGCVIRRAGGRAARRHIPASRRRRIGDLFFVLFEGLRRIPQIVAILS